MFKVNAARSKPSSKMPRFKFGVQVPHNSREAYKLDDINKDKLWEEAMEKEVVSINDHETFIILEDDEIMPEGYKQIPYHLVFDAKFDGRRKARLVAGGHRAPDVSKEESYSGVVSMETIRVAFVLASMNNLDVCAADISTAFYMERQDKRYLVRQGKSLDEILGREQILIKVYIVCSHQWQDFTTSLQQVFKNGFQAIQSRF